MTKREVEEYIMSQIFPNASHEVTAQNVRNAFAPIVEQVWTYLEGRIGDLSQLQTADKQSVVNAINAVLGKMKTDIDKVNADIATLGSKVGELSDDVDNLKIEIIGGTQVIEDELDIIEGKYINWNGALADAEKVFYTKPIAVKAGCKYIYKGRGYKTSYGMISETDALGSMYSVQVRSIDSTLQEYEYTPATDGFIAVTGFVTYEHTLHHEKTAEGITDIVDTHTQEIEAINKVINAIEEDWSDWYELQLNKDSGVTTEVEIEKDKKYDLQIESTARATAFVLGYSTETASLIVGNYNDIYHFSHSGNLRFYAKSTGTLRFKIRKNTAPSALPVNIYINQDGSGDFKTLTEFLQVYKGDTRSKKVYIYSGVYDILEEKGGLSYLQDAIDQGARGETWRTFNEIVPPNTTIEGIGRVELTMSLPDDVSEDVAKCFAPLNLDANCEISNVSIYAKNARYAVHDESSALMKNDYSFRIFKNVKMKKEGIGYNQSYGAGHNKGSLYIFENCSFDSGGDVMTWTTHLQNGGGSNFVFKSCIFNGKVMFLTKGTSVYVENYDSVIMENCKANKIISQLNSGESGTSKNNYKITLFNCPSAILTIDNPSENTLEPEIITL